MSKATTFDQAKMDAFVGKALGEASAAFTATLCNLGDRLGLFKDLDSRGPATSAELAQRTGNNERYVREWLGGMTAAGYLEYDPAIARFILPPEHAPVLAHESGPVFFGGVYQFLPPFVAAADRVAEKFRTGGGVPQDTYGDAFWDGVERFSSTWYENLLIPVWLPAMPDVAAKLEQAADVADVGCGRGRALIKLAEAFPTSQYVGYDAYLPTIARATANAREAGVADRVRFEQLDAAQELPERYDVITTIDVIHDAVNPRGVLRSIRKGLRPDGIYVMLETNSSPQVEENAGPIGAFLYSASLLYCMTTSLAQGGEGLGAAGLGEAKVRELCAEAGFSSVRRLPIENPINILYEIRP